MKDIIKLLVPLLIEAAKAAIDKFIAGEKLNEYEVKAVQTAYAAGKVWLVDVVNDSVNTYDNAALDAFFASCEDTAAEGGFTLPQIPD